MQKGYPKTPLIKKILHHSRLENLVQFEFYKKANIKALTNFSPVMTEIPEVFEICFTFKSITFKDTAYFSECASCFQKQMKTSVFFVHG